MEERSKYGKGKGEGREEYEAGGWEGRKEDRQQGGKAGGLIYYHVAVCVV